LGSLNTSYLNTSGLMSDITSQQFDEYIRQMRETVGLLDKLSRQNEKTARAAAKTPPQKTPNKTPQQPQSQMGSKVLPDLTKERQLLRKDMALDRKNRSESTRNFARDVGMTATGLSSSFKMLDSDVRGLGRSFVDLTKRFAGLAAVGFVLESMIDLGTHWVSNYREMINVGQSFNGSVISMAREAAQAGLPLQQFSEFVKKNSRIMATFGARDVSQLAKRVRETTHQVGMYGYSVEGMNELTATWLDMQRLQGNRWAAVSSTSSRSIENFAQEITKLSGATGKSRDEILANARQLAQSGEITAAVLANPELKNNPLMEQSLAWIGSMGEQAQNLFGEVFGKAALNAGRINESETIKLMNSIGIGGPFASAMQQYQQLLKAGIATAEDRERVEDVFSDSVERAGGVISTLITDNPALGQLTQAKADIDSRRSEAGREALANAKQMDEITKFLLTIRSKLDIIKGRFLDGVLSGLQHFVGVLAKMEGDGTLAWFGDTAEKVGKQLGKVLGDMVKFMATDEFAVAVTSTIRGIVALGGVMLTLTSWALKIVEGFQSIGKAISTEHGGLLGALMTLTAYIAGRAFLSRLFSGVSNMNVAATSVFVNGRLVGGGVMATGGGGGGKDGKGSKTPKSRAPRGGLRGGGGWPGIVLGTLAIAGLGAYLSKDSETDPQEREETDQVPPEQADPHLASIDTNTAESVEQQRRTVRALGTPDPGIARLAEAAAAQGMSVEQLMANQRMEQMGTNTILDMNGNPVQIVNGQWVIPPEAFPEPATNVPSETANQSESNDNSNEENTGEAAAAEAPSFFKTLLSGGALAILGSLLLRRAFVGSAASIQNLATGRARVNLQTAFQQRNAARARLNDIDARRPNVTQGRDTASRADTRRWITERRRARTDLANAKERLNARHADMAVNREARLRRQLKPTIGQRVGQTIGNTRVGRALAPAMDTTRHAARRAGGAMARVPGMRAAGKVAGKMGGKGLGYIMPGVGLVLGGLDAYHRAKDGDWTGAAISMGAGVASTVPKLGTAVSMGLIGANVYRDYKRDQQPQTQRGQQQPRPPARPTGAREASDGHRKRFLSYNAMSLASLEEWIRQNPDDRQAIGVYRAKLAWLERHHGNRHRAPTDVADIVRTQIMQAQREPRVQQARPARADQPAGGAVQQARGLWAEARNAQAEHRLRVEDARGRLGVNDIANRRQSTTQQGSPVQQARGLWAEARNAQAQHRLQTQQAQPPQPPQQARAVAPAAPSIRQENTPVSAAVAGTLARPGATPELPPALVQHNALALHELRRSSNTLEQRIPPMTMPTMSLRVETAMLRILTQMRETQEALVVHTRNGAAAADHAAKSLKEIKDRGAPI
jgi:hypothetical protein